MPQSQEGRPPGIDGAPLHVSFFRLRSPRPLHQLLTRHILVVPVFSVMDA